MEFFNSTDILNLLTLTGLEIILGVDNVIFIALLVSPLPTNLQKKVRFYGLSLALILRIAMLFGAKWLISLTNPLFEIFSFDVTGKTLLFIVGGGFLMIKSIAEIISMFNEEEEAHEAKKDSKAKIISIIYQIVFIDIVLSFDSIIAAIAMSPNNITVIIIAVIISLIIMLLFSGSLGEFINKHQSIKILGLVFIFFVGIMLFGEGFKVEISKAYLYFSIVFSLITESINILLSKKRVK